MHKKDRVAYIQQRLQEIYPETPIPLDHEDAYTLLIAVLLSAQCTDKRVNAVMVTSNCHRCRWTGQCQQWWRKFHHPDQGHLADA